MTIFLDSSPTAQNDNKISFHAIPSAEVALGDFVGFRARDYEIRLMVYRIVEHEESRESVKDTNAPKISCK